MDKDKLMQEDLYELLEILPDSDEQAIKKAYRKKALKCHPDKNPDNPQAASLFLELSVAIDILLGEKSRIVYDKLYKARKAAAVRNNLLDDKRKRLKTELEERERLAQSHTSGKKTFFATLNEIDRLRKEGSRHLLEEIEKLNKELAEREERLMDMMQTPYESKFKPKTSKTLQIKIKWDNSENKRTYNEENIKKLFSKYGNVEFVVVNKKKKNSAIFELIPQIDGLFAVKLERGFPDNPFQVTILNEDKLPNPGTRPNIFPSMSESTRTTSNFPDLKTESSKTKNDDIDYEEQILNRLRQFEQNKRARETT